MSKEKQTEFESAGHEKNAGVVGEFLAMLKENKKFWLLPIVIALMAVGVIVILGTTAAGPFIYTLF
jgi:hypothetical protein